MSEDQVTIDPEFLPHPDRGRGRGPFWVPIAAAVVAAFAFGWLLNLSAPIESDSTEAAGSTSTAARVETTPTTVAATTSVPRTPGLAVLDVPLSDAVPGFSDTILMLSTPAESFNVIQWRPSEPTPETVLSVSRHEFGVVGALPVGLDASGDWFGQIVLPVGDDALTVHSIPDDAGESSDREIVALRVGTPLWHDTEPGRLAWLACPRSSQGLTALFTLDVSDRSSEPVELRSTERDCRDLELLRWGSWGVLTESWRDDGLTLVRADGTDMAIEFGSWILADGTILRTEHIPRESGASWFLISPDDQQRNPLPGRSNDGQLLDAAWSPDGTHLAIRLSVHLGPEPFSDGTSALRVVDMAANTIIEQVAELGSDVITMEWSSDSRFLLYETWQDANHAAVLAFYDTANHTTTTVPLTDFVDEIRVSND